MAHVHHSPKSGATPGTLSSDYKRNSSHVYNILRQFPPHEYPGLGIDQDTAWLRNNPKRVGRVRLLRPNGKGAAVLLFAVRLRDPDAPDGWVLQHYVADRQSHVGQKGLGPILAFLDWKQNPGPDADDALILDVLWWEAKRLRRGADAIFKMMVLPVGYHAAATQTVKPETAP